ncbi:hypothetical protein [Streptosporangium pseudovulgare]|uniref:Uncharacterized protein n=1 Tax=Streptosporangium pseudovulgare TaxID=35765 RepID=A0ABQ2R9Q2_9ACTN|nr:hypothetical protein [Streptosporangium pseudovulgare]GGQ19780.1 hypothetical protein GCM10010140_57670 [Streptosporangium pseudovulgare]
MGPLTREILTSWLHTFWGAPTWPLDDPDDLDHSAVPAVPDRGHPAPGPARLAAATGGDVPLYRSPSGPSGAAGILPEDARP